MTDSLLVSHKEKKLLQGLPVSGGSSTFGVYITDNAGDQITADDFTFTGSVVKSNYTLVGNTIVFNADGDLVFNHNTIFGSDLNVGRINVSDYNISYQPYINNYIGTYSQLDCILFGSSSEVSNSSIVIGNRAKCDNYLSLVIGHDSVIYPSFNTVDSTYISDNCIIVGHNSTINSAEITLVEPSSPSRTVDCLLFGCNSETAGYAICIGNDTTSTSFVTATGSIAIGHGITNTRNSIILGHGITNTTAQGALCLGVAPDKVATNACFIKRRSTGYFYNNVPGQIAVFEGAEMIAGPTAEITTSIDGDATEPVYLKIVEGSSTYFFQGLWNLM